ncbi:hypothetical protein COCOBI_06-6670 [Coccomyxa sp. Obi]|nr:hypothetical protein COCOBI_06-6670 [Coccomyxa sp. Obi]
MPSPDQSCGEPNATPEKGSRQKAHRQREKERRQAVQRQLQELSQKVKQLELEKEQLRGALRSTANETRAVSVEIRGQGPPGKEEVVLTLCFGAVSPQLQLTRDEAAALRLEAMAGIWKARSCRPAPCMVYSVKRLVQKMAYCLDMMAAAPTSMQRPFHLQIEDLVRELVDFIWCMADHNLSTLMLLPSKNVVDPSAPFPASGDPRDFPTILARMQLSPGQAKQLLAARRAWLHAMGALTAEPDNILAYLKDVEEKKGVVSMAGFMEIGHVKEALSTTVHAMNICRTFYVSYIHTQLLTPLQTARYMVGCLPMGPDLPGLLSCLARQYGEPSFEELLHAARRGTAGPATASSGAGARSGSEAKPGSGANLRAGAKTGGPADSGLPPCMAGDWRHKP